MSLHLPLGIISVWYSLDYGWKEPSTLLHHIREKFMEPSGWFSIRLAEEPAGLPCKKAVWWKVEGRVEGLLPPVIHLYTFIYAGGGRMEGEIKNSLYMAPIRPTDAQTGRPYWVLKFLF
jgi:hypothetical protein